MTSCLNFGDVLPAHILESQLGPQSQLIEGAARRLQQEVGQLAALLADQRRALRQSIACSDPAPAEGEFVRLYLLDLASRLMGDRDYGAGWGILSV